MIQRIHEDTGVPAERIEATLRLLDQGAAVPFIARYRKDATGNLDERKIRRIARLHRDLQQLEKRRQEILSVIVEAGSATEELSERVRQCSSREEMEDLYLPHRSRSLSKTALARKRGLGDLADYIRQGHPTSEVADYALRFVGDDKEVPSVEAAVEAAMQILTEQLAEDPESRKWLRRKMTREGVLETAVSGEKASQSTKYSMYYDFSEPISRIPSHRVLAVRRAARQNLLTFSLKVNEADALEEFKARVRTAPDTPLGELLETAAENAYRRLLEPSIQKQVRALLRSRAEDEAIGVFQDNLMTLLLAPLAGPVPLIGVDPGLERGTHLAAVNTRGGLAEHQKIRLADAEPDLGDAERVLMGMINAHAIRGIVIGSGRGARAAEDFLRSLVDKHALEIFVAAIPESTASTLSGKHARRDFPDLEAGYRRAISTARRLQDPLSELVKVDPRSIGVGQYQHDVDQRKLRARLVETVASAVCRVGVDANTASVELLRNVAGLTDKLARSVVAHRNHHGAFRDRSQLRQVAGFDEQVFQQAAGFLRVDGGSNPLDRTWIHPESYPLVERMAGTLDLRAADLLGNAARIKSLDFDSFRDAAGPMTLADIRSELLTPGRDPRRPFVAPRLREAVRDRGDLELGMELEGVVTNVTNFGAFVDLGIHQDGLIHISELSHRYVADARRAVQVGSVVRVKVIGIDADGKRISLSRKALIPKPDPRAKQKRRSRGSRADGKPESKGSRDGRPRTKETAVPLKSDRLKRRAESKPQSMEEKIRRLQEKFKSPDR